MDAIQQHMFDTYRAARGWRRGLRELGRAVGVEHVLLDGVHAFQPARLVAGPRVD
ncbi:hypothetical protein [Streptomyces parvus]|uniref:hypothetical protein n=1 Tax=Streptomyces parvus TaxID=66428 RepID=UPI00142EDA44|nr:hypothetical protein [Streptomyces parvus]